MLTDALPAKAGTVHRKAGVENDGPRRVHAAFVHRRRWLRPPPTLRSKPDYSAGKHGDTVSMIDSVRWLRVVVCAASFMACGYPPLAQLPDNGDAAPLDTADRMGGIFATSEKYQGNLGGLAGADDKCNSAATSRALPGIYRAWISSSTTDAISRIQGNGPWYRVDGTTLVFSNRAALMGTPLAAVLSDEFGTPTTTSSNVWTGTAVGGVHTAFTCQDWTAVNVSATWGLAAGNDASWTQSPTGAEPCSDFVRLLCLRAD